MLSLAGQVNRRVASARVILVELDSRPERGAFAQQALLEAALFQLCCGYTHYLRELCAYYGVSQLEAIDTEAEAQQALQQLGKEPAEVAELCLLAQRPSTWLGQLLSSYRACWRLANSAGGDELIPVQRLEEGAVSELTQTLLHQWLAEFTATIERHRQSSLEC
jgi:hypothetical protein